MVGLFYEQLTQVFNRYLFESEVLQSQMAPFKQRAIAIKVTDLSFASMCIFFNDDLSVQMMPLDIDQQEQAAVVIEGAMIDLIRMSWASSDTMQQLVNISGDVHLMLALRKILLDKHSGLDIFFNRCLGDRQHFLLRMFWQSIRQYMKKCTDSVSYMATENALTYRIAPTHEHHVALKHQFALLKKQMNHLAHRIHQQEI